MEVHKRPVKKRHGYESISLSMSSSGKGTPRQSGATTVTARPVYLAPAKPTVHLKTSGTDTADLRIYNTLYNSVGTQYVFEEGVPPEQLMHVDSSINPSEVRSYFFKCNPTSFHGLRGDVFYSSSGGST